ncbi:MAG TPA: SRPBCC family protein [Hyphomicrobiales bacterium]|nr:SRPBCC family protein [Kaistiaceae bacterium]HQF30946.1 SRPBCC family protein [Hyphomicrobiales bacterium]
MAFLKWLMWMTLIAFLGLVMVGFMLPRDIAVTRTTTIAAPVEKVYAEVASPKATRDWLPWGKLDDDTEYAFEGPEAGNGAIMTWKNPKYRDYGMGRQTIVSARPNERVVSELDLGKMGVSHMAIELFSEGVDTRADIKLETGLGHSPFARWVGLLLDDWLAEDLDKALAGLKAKVEAQPAN